MQYSYSCSPSTLPYMYQTVPDRLRQLAASDPNREAFIYYDLNKTRSSLTRKQLLEQSTNAAKLLIQSGLKKGSNVAFCMNNSLPMLVTNMGVIMAGGIPFYFTTNLKDGSDLVEFINNLEAEFLFLDTHDDNENWKVLENIWPFEEKRSNTVPTLKMVVCNGRNFTETETRIMLSSFLARVADEEITLPLLHPEDTLVYFCTSGSTGKPKIVVYTHYNILNWTRFTNISLGIKENNIFFCDRTFSWAVGFPRTYLAEGTTRVFVDIKLTVAGKHSDLICDIINEERCDVVYLPGYMAADLLKNTQLSGKFKNVQTIFLSGERVLKSVFCELKRTFCRRVLIFYGSTESGGASSYATETDDEFEDGIIGMPIEGAEMKIIDNYGNVVPLGTKGELCIRCSWMFAGYRGRKDLFHETVDNLGWFHTGDIAHFRNDGCCILDGRGKEMISIGTYKVFPWTVERALKNIQGAGIVFAVGVPDSRLNQVVCACVLPKPGITITEADLKKFCDDTFLEESTSMGVNLKPRYHIILDKVPLTPTGKIDRNVIALQAAEKLGLNTSDT